MASFDIFKLAIAITLLAIFAPSLLAQDVLVGKCVIPLEFGGQNLFIAPSSTTVEDDVITDMTVLIDNSTDTPGWVYIMDFPTSYPVEGMEVGLSAAMKNLCGRVSVGDYGKGFLGTGLFKKGGQLAWGAVLPIDPIDGKYKRMAMVIAAFKNDTFNAQIVRSLKVENIKC